MLDPNLLTQNVTRLPGRFAGSAEFEEVCSALAHQQIQLLGKQRDAQPQGEVQSRDNLQGNHSRHLGRCQPHILEAGVIRAQ